MTKMHMCVLTLVVVCVLFFSCLLPGGASGEKDEIASLKESINSLQKELTRTQDVIEI